MKHIASCSFGKDSCAAILVRLQHGEPVDECVYCRIMFDENTSAEYPEHEEWIHKTAIPLLKGKYGIKTTIVQAEATYTDQFYTTYRRGKNAGRIYGFPLLRGPWCNSRLKMRPIKALKNLVGEHKSIVGIAADEAKRINRAIVSGEVLHLVEHGITEEKAFEIASDGGLLSPAYSNGRKRLGCWFCHNQRISELRRLRSEHPELWSKLINLDRISPCTFRPGQTLCEFDRRFAVEEAQLSLFD